MKEQTKLILRVKDQQSECENLSKDKQDTLSQVSKIKEREKGLEFKVNSMQQQVKATNEMVSNLKRAMPSDDLRNLVS